jgi:YidC/Oxa1 family membrane protein insertase
VDNNRNLILAVVLSIVLFFGWQFAMNKYYPEPKHPAAPVPTLNTGSADKMQGTAPPAKARPTREGGLQDAKDIALEQKDLSADLAAPGRVRIDAPKVLGSINPVGARIDDLELKTHRQTVAK